MAENNGFVLDNSVAMRWLLVTEKASDQDYADQVLESLVTTDAWVPDLWHLEACNVLSGAEKRLEINLGEIEKFVAQLEKLPIRIDPLTAQQSFNRTLALGRAYGLSSYDASYLELAIRQNMPIATLDKALLKAAKHSGLTCYLK